MDCAVSLENRRSGMAVVLQKGFKERGSITMRQLLQMKDYAELAGQRSRWDIKHLTTKILLCLLSSKYHYIILRK
jgi:hypothetical protein